MLDQLVQAIESAVPPNRMTTKIVAIDGGGGAGKSTLAAALTAQLSSSAVIHVDDFIPGPSNDPSWWLRLRDQVFIPLSLNQPARYQCFDWNTRKLAQWHAIATGGIVIIEGFSALRPEFRPMLAYGIWVEAPAALRLGRGLARGNEDLVQWQKWQISDRAYFDAVRPDKAADVIIDGTKVYE